MKWVLSIAAIFLVIAAVTKPDEATVRAAVRDKHGLVVSLAAAFGELVGTAQYRYHDYVVFSTLTLRSMDGSEETVATGIFGSVSVKDAGNLGE